MTLNERNSKGRGIIGSLLFHVLLITSFLFMGLKYQDPPPAEEGISINFGFIDEGSGNLEPEQTDDIIEIVEEESVEKQIESKENIIVQSEIESPILEKVKEEKKIIQNEKENEEVIEKKKPEVNKKALYPGKKKTQHNSKGNTNNEGDQGVIEGDPDAYMYEGGGAGEDGTTYQLGGRDVAFKAKPIYNLQIEGKVVVIITVDRLGNVINAITGAKGSTTLNKKLLQRAKSAALKTKFEAKQSAPTNQQGKIIYYFQLN